MSYEADVHPSQVKILQQLLFTQTATFSELQKQTGLDSDLFNFHLKQIVAAGFVSKAETGTYQLTTDGKRYANRINVDSHQLEQQAKLSVVIVIEDDTGRQLYQRRLKQPYFGYWGHPTTKVAWGETLLAAAERGLYDETKLRAELRIAGVFHKLDHDQVTKSLIEDKYLYLIHGTHPTGTLITDLEGHHNEWLTFDNILAKDKVFGNPAETNQVLHQPEQFIVEKNYYYPLQEY